MAINVVDVVLAIGIFFYVGIVAVELSYTFEHRIGALTQPDFILRVLVTQPVKVRDLGLAGKDVVDLPVGACAFIFIDPFAVDPASRIDPVPAGAVRLLGIGKFPKTDGTFFPGLASQIKVAHLGGDVVGKLLQSIEPHYLGNKNAFAAPLLR